MRKRHVIELLVALVVTATGVLTFLCLRQQNEDKEIPSDTVPLVYDNAATPGGWEEMNTDDLNGKVAAGMMNISMNTIPVFADGASEGNLMIVNEEVNRYPQIVEISRNDTGETIYTSGAIPVGSRIEAARLDKELAEGKYDCTALFYSVDPDTGARLGCAGAAITITIR